MAQDDRLTWVREELRDDIKDLRQTIRDDLALLRAENAAAHDAVAKRLDGYSVRIRRLENWRSWVLGIGTAAGFLGSWLWQWLRVGRSS